MHVLRNFRVFLGPDSHRPTGHDETVEFRGVLRREWVVCRYRGSFHLSGVSIWAMAGGPRGGVCATATHSLILIWYMLCIMCLNNATQSSLLHSVGWVEGSLMRANTSSISRRAVSIDHRLVTDRQTDRHGASIALAQRRRQGNKYQLSRDGTVL